MKKCIIFLIVLCLFLNFPCSATGQSEILLEADSKTVLSSYNADTPLPMASLTKIMTAYVVLTHSDINKIVEIKPESVGIEGSSMYLKAGEKYTVKELLYGLLLVSGNDAAHALALFTGKTIDGFAEMMNETANKLGLRNSYFKNPSGLYEKGHYTTARDLAILTAEALKNDIFSEIVKTKSYTVHEKTLINHNRLLKEIDGCIGVKTGFTKVCGRCLVSAVQREGVTLICVTLNCPNDWNRHKKLYNENFKRCKVKKIIKEKEIYNAIEVVGGHNAGYYILATNAVIIDNKQNTQYKIHVPHFIYCNKKKGDTVGYAEILMNGVCIKTVPLILDRTTVAYPEFKRSFFQKIKEFVLHIFHV